MPTPVEMSLQGSGVSGFRDQRTVAIVLIPGALAERWNDDSAKTVAHSESVVVVERCVERAESAVDVEVIG